MNVETKTKPITLLLLTGFLGSGKTTLLNHLLESEDLGTIGILMNEFGAVGVDGALVRHHAQDPALSIYEVSDGSIFCTCKTASFVAGLRMFAHLPEEKRPKRIVVEASGMSDPSGLTKLLRENRLAAEYHVSEIVCLVDAVRFPKVVKTLPAVRRQVEAADVVLVNKTDLVGDGDISDLDAMIGEMNGSARLVHTTFGRLPEGLWSGTTQDLAGDLVSCSRPENRPASLHLQWEDATRVGVEGFLRHAVPLTFRVKGWLQVDGNWYFVSDNSGRVEWKQEHPPQGSRPGLVVICPPDNADDVADLWREVTAEHHPIS